MKIAHKIQGKYNNLKDSPTEFKTSGDFKNRKPMDSNISILGQNSPSYSNFKLENPPTPGSDTSMSQSRWTVRVKKLLDTPTNVIQLEIQDSL